jgi:citrate synthase
MNVFWREEPLSEAEHELYLLVSNAHHFSALRENVSNQAVVLSAVGSGDYYKSIAAGLMTLGGTHGPIEETVMFLKQGYDALAASVRRSYAIGLKIPGWGNSFYRAVEDPLWADVRDCLAVKFPEAHGKLKTVTGVWAEVSGKPLYPNPSAFTAVAAIEFEMPPKIAPFLLVLGRLSAWTQLVMENMKPK